MSDTGRVKFDYAQSNWRQSIAVKIASQIIWILVPTAFVASFFIFNEIDNYILQNFEFKVESLTYRITNVLVNSPSLTQGSKGQVINNIAKDLDFSAVKVVSPNYKLSPSIDVSQFEPTTRTVQLPTRDNFENELISVTCYHEPLSSIIKKTQKNVLGFIIIFLTVLASLLVYSIRNKIYRPLSMLVDATEAATNGDAEIVLETDRKDEFGHLSIFFKKMLDRLNEQHKQLKESAEEAKRANSAKSVFLANMSHELRTPLNAIIGYGELVIEDNDGSISDTHTQDLQKIVSAGHHLLHLINEILDLSKVEAGKLEVDPDNVDLSDMFNELAITISPLVEQNNNKLIVDCSPQVRKIYSDNMKVRQILINLLGNACKFTKDGTISLKAEPCTTKSTDHVSFSVSDTGTGIKQEYIDNLFQPFSQGDESLTRSHGGTGLGLSICQRLSILLGGDITVDSVEGKGTTFTVTLPATYTS
jgi:signal transduction histidine kinase